MSELSHEQFTFVLRFIHPEKTQPALTEAMLAAINAIPVETYRQIKLEIAAATQGPARELLAEPGFAEKVGRLPFAPGSTVVGLGDSITDDLASWIEIVRTLLELCRPHDHIRVINAGISGETTTHMLARTLGLVTAEKPAWVICMAGTNDVRKSADRPLKVEVSPDETEKNLAQLRDFAATRTSARWCG